ncbi:MAG: hypothetical protein Q9226_006022 [Calogaya cf. arnoldii]
MAQADGAQISDNQEFDNQAPEPHDHEFDKLIKLMDHKLPQELIDNVEYWLYELVFCPGYLYPYYSGRRYATYCSVPPKTDRARPDLLCLNKSIKAKYETRLWRENTWVIVAGVPTPSVTFLEKRFTDARQYIQKVHVKIGHPRYPTPLEFGFYSEWELVTALPLQRLVLDYTECHLEWSEEPASLLAVRNPLSWPKNKVMPELEVLAPAAELDEVNSIVRRNTLLKDRTA